MGEIGTDSSCQLVYEIVVVNLIVLNRVDHGNQRAPQSPEARKRCIPCNASLPLTSRQISELDEDQHGRTSTPTLPHCIAKAGVNRLSADAPAGRPCATRRRVGGALAFPLFAVASRRHPFRKSLGPWD
jgi:hypothetical protein